MSCHGFKLQWPGLAVWCPPPTNCIISSHPKEVSENMIFRTSIAGVVSWLKGGEVLTN